MISQSEDSKKDRDTFGLKQIIQGLASFLCFAAVLFISAGSLNWKGGWLYLGMWVLSLGIMLPVISRMNPVLFRVRRRKYKDTKALDKIILGVYSPMLALMILVAALDHRFSWTSLPFTWSLIGMTFAILAIIPGMWAMAVNPHFETTVRIQKERSHKVISTGPYKFVRHPGYVSAILIILPSPLILGSYWSFIPAGMIILLFIIRTAFEDKTLYRELEGYAAYAKKVRYRLLPGIW